MKWLNGFSSRLSLALKPLTSRLPRWLRLPRSGGGYPYTNTRVRVMRTKLIHPREYAKLVRMEFAEIARVLQDSEYKREINELATQHAGANLIEYALNRNLENTFARIGAFSIRTSHQQIDLYLRRYDVANVKTFLAGRRANETDAEILAQLVCAGELPRSFFERAIREARSYDDAVHALSGTRYHGVAAAYKDDLARMQDELDKQYYREVIENGEDELLDFIRDEIKAKNTLNWLRAQKTNVKPDALPDESEADLRLPHAEESVENRVFLRKFLLKRGYDMAREFKKNIRPVLGYMIAKENEISNLRLIVRAKSARLPLDVIEAQVI